MSVILHVNLALTPNATVVLKCGLTVMLHSKPEGYMSVQMILRLERIVAKCTVPCMRTYLVGNGIVPQMPVLRKSRQDKLAYCSVQTTMHMVGQLLVKKTAPGW